MEAVPVKKGRPKGSKNKPKDDFVIEAPVEIQQVPGHIYNDMKSMGMDMTNVRIKPEAPKPEKAAAAFDPSMLDIDRKLEELAFSQPDISDMNLDVKMKPESVNSDFLGDHMEDYKPAENIAQLEEQVFLALSQDCDSIEGSEKLIRYYTKKEFELIQNSIGYFIYKNVKVHLPGWFKKAQMRDKKNLYLDNKGA